MPEYVNIGNLYRGETAQTPFKTAPANFTVGGEDSIVMTKQVENPDQLYFSGDTINSIIFNVYSSKHNVITAIGSFLYKTTLHQKL